MNHNQEQGDLLCPLCRLGDGVLFYHDQSPRNRGGRGVDYFRCEVCQLVFMGAWQFVTAVDEKKVYDLHQNSPDDFGYRRFLSRLSSPMISQLPPGCHGLDFGSGPGPTLSLIFAEAGHTMAIYDPFYAPDKRPLHQSYDFITATEVVEHLHRPQVELALLWACLRPQGLLGIMTKRVKDVEAFAGWHYKNDPTHVSFFALETFEWLAAHWGATLTVLDKDIVLFGKSE